MKLNPLITRPMKGYIRIERPWNNGSTTYNLKWWKQYVKDFQKRFEKAVNEAPPSRLRMTTPIEGSLGGSTGPAHEARGQMI
jgi:hypothetical protein